MEIILTQNDVEILIKTFSRISTKNIHHPALKLIRLSIQDKILTISATNLSLGIEVLIPIAQHDSFNNKDFYVQLESFIKNIQSIQTYEKISVNFNETYIEIKTKQSKSKILFEDGSDMPLVPVIKGQDFEIKKDILIKGITNTLYTASTTDIKPELSSILISQKEDQIVFVSTDAFQLVEYTQEYKDSNEQTYLLPVKEAGDILKCLECFTEDTVHIIKNENSIEYKTFNIRVVSKITQGNFPDYKQIIPKSVETKIIFLQKDLEEAIKFISQNNPKNNHVECFTKEDKMFFKIQNINNGENEFFIPIQKQGEDIAIYILFTHLKNSITVLKEDSLEFNFVAKQKPIIIKPVNKNNIIYLLMPISL